MSNNESILIKAVSRSDWFGDLLLLPMLVNSGKQLDRPGEKVGDVLFVESAEGDRKLLVSLGKQDQLKTETFRQVGGSVAKWLINRKVDTAAVHALTLQGLGGDAGIAAFCEGLLLGGYHFNRYKSEDPQGVVTQVSLLAETGPDLLDSIVNRVTAVASGVNLSRNLAHEPPNIINPKSLAERAEEMAEENGLEYTLLDTVQLQEMGAGAIVSVGQGSQTGSQMIILRYAGQPEFTESPPVVVVGKAITFDTGGYSIKDRTGMVGMKYDKCGGAAVFGLMKAVGILKPEVPVIGIIAAAENMVSAQAYRPNDIIQSLSGKTIEIISTDAEGRMVLADALTYAHTHFEPRVLIDLATLTGGVVVALGKVRAGIMSNNDALADALFSSGERTHERLWRMPLDEEYFDLIRGDDSDFKNSSGVGQAHPIVGGIFLKQFIPDQVPWAHIDIAGPATTDKDLAYCPKGATGFGVRLLIDYIQDLD